MIAAVRNSQVAGGKASTTSPRGASPAVPCFRPQKHVRVVSSVAGRAFFIESQRCVVIVPGVGPNGGIARPRAAWRAAGQSSMGILPMSRRAILALRPTGVSPVVVVAV